MITVSATIFIHRPIEHVFAYLKDFKRIPQWRTDVTKVIGDFYRPAIVGTTFIEVIEFFGPQSYTMRMASENPPSTLIIQAVKGSFLLTTEKFYCAEKNNMTFVTFQGQIIPTTFLFKILAPLFEIVLQKKWQDHLGLLKQNLETTVPINETKKQLVTEAL